MTHLMGFRRRPGSTLAWPIAICLVGAVAYAPTSAGAGSTELQLTSTQVLAKAVSSLRYMQNMSMNVTCSGNFSKMLDGSGPRTVTSTLDFKRNGEFIDISDKRTTTINEHVSESMSFRRRVVISNKCAAFYQLAVTDESTPTSGIVSVNQKDEMIQNYAGELFTSSALEGYMYCTGGMTLPELALQSRSNKITGVETINQVPCTILEASTDHGHIRLWLAAQYGYLPVKYDFEKLPHHITIGDRKLGEDQMVLKRGGTPQRSRQWAVQMREVRFGEVNGQTVPIGGRLTEVWTFGDGQSTVRDFVYERHDIKLNPAFARDTFLIDIPEGARVTNLDDKSGVVYSWYDGHVIPESVYMEKFQYGRYWRSRWPVFIAGLVGLAAIAIAFVFLRKYRPSRNPSEVAG